MARIRARKGWPKLIKGGVTGLPTRFTYDNLARLTRTEIDQPITGGGTLATSRILYNDPLRRRIEIDARGNRTTFDMDEQQRVVTITDPDGETQRFEYDGVNKTAELDKRGARTEFTYDSINRLTEVRDALGQTVSTEYRDAERQVVETDKRRLVRTTQLDALGRLVSVTRSGTRLEAHTYDGNSNRVISTDANGNQTQFLYDGANRMVERVDGLGSDEETRATFLYDDVGNLLEEKDGRDTGVAFDVRNTYDRLNRLTTTTDALGNTSTFEYDEEGNRTAVLEPKSPDHRTEFTYGELNELIEVRMADGGVYRYGYDPNRNRTRQEDAEGNVVTFTYDRLNRVDRMTQDPGGFNYVTDHDYDPNGNEIRLRDPKGQVIDFGYDELNRLKTKTYNLTAADFELLTRTHEITYHYDPNNNLERIDELKSSGTDPPAVVSSFKTYDTLDRLTSETDAWGRTLGYGYDPQGNRTSLTDPDSVRTEYTFDELNRLETLTLEAGTPGAQAVAYDYFPDGLKRLVTNPNGTTSTYTYDAADRMTTITHDGATGTVSAYVYDYDPNGNRTQQIETNAGRTETTIYDYDRVNRLTVVTYEVGTANATQTTYTYDLIGNRLTEQNVELAGSVTTKNVLYAYDAIHRLDTITDNLGASDDVAYTYDPNGNTLTKTKAGVATEFKYDIRDQLGEVTQGTSVLGRYGYDSEGLRILKIGDDGLRRYTYDQLSVITEADQTNATVSKYDYGLDQLVSLDNAAEGRSFFHLDILGSTVSLSDSGGTTQQSILYDAWGNERDRAGASANNFTFTGHEKDQETGLIYAKARFYDPEVGRFLSQDDRLGEVSDAPTLHRYAYVMSNPLRLVDPTGNVATPVTGEAGDSRSVFNPNDPLPEGQKCFFGVCNDRQSQLERINQRLRDELSGVVLESGDNADRLAGDVADFFGGPAERPPKFAEDVLDTAAGFTHGAFIQVPIQTAEGVVVLLVVSAKVMELDAKIKFGTEETRRQAMIERQRLIQSVHDEIVQSAKFLGRGVQNTDAVFDAIVELGPARSGSILGTSSVEGVLIVDSGISAVRHFRRARSIKFAELAQARAQELHAIRRAKSGTTAVIRVRNRATGRVETWIATDAPSKNIPSRLVDELKPGERYIGGEGHAEDVIMRAVDSGQWEILDGGTSRNICRGTCAPALTQRGFEIGGPTFRGKPHNTEFRMFFQSAPPASHSGPALLWIPLEVGRGAGNEESESR